MRRLVILLVVILFVAAVPGSGSEQFLETFDDGYSQWQFVNGQILGEGNPAPSFTGQNDWIISNQTFDYTDGLIIEADIYVAGSLPASRWSGVRFGLVLPSFAGTHPPADMSVKIQYAYSDETQFPRQGSFLVILYTDTAVIQEKYYVDYSTEPRANDYLGDWHTHRIVISPDQTVQYYVEDELIYTALSKLDLSFTGGSLGVSAENQTGAAFIDNVRVLSYPVPIVHEPQPILCMTQLEIQGSQVMMEVTNYGDAPCRGETVSSVGLSYCTSWVPEWCTIFQETEYGEICLLPGESINLAFDLQSVPAECRTAFAEQLETMWTGYVDPDPEDYLGVVFRIGPEHCYGFLPDTE